MKKETNKGIKKQKLLAITKRQFWLLQSFITKCDNQLITGWGGRQKLRQSLKEL